MKKSKFLIIFLIVAIIIMCSVYSKTFAFSYESLDFKYGRVTTECLNIRCGPGVSYNKVGKLKKDDYVNVFAKVGNWYIVQTDSNLIGAVSSDYIEAVLDENEVMNAIQEKDSKIVSTSNEVVDQESYDVVATEFSDELELSLDEQEFLNLINSNRKNNKLEELKVDKQIQNVARLKAQDLEKNDYFSHKSPTYGNIDSMLKTFEISYEISGENIAGNKNLSGAIEAWMNSENHKANILSEDFNYTGVAVVDSKQYGKIFVEVFVKK